MITNINIINFNKYNLTAYRIKILLEKSKAVIWYPCDNLPHILSMITNFDKHL